MADITAQPSVNNAAQADEGVINDCDATAKSLRCDNCGKLFRDIDYAQMHGTRTGHANFSESTQVILPFTEDEKKAKLEALQVRMAQRKEEKRLQDIRDAKESERIRRKAGQELIEAQERLKEKEMIQIAEEKKREKVAEKTAKAKILAEIEQDKRDRLARQQGHQNVQAIPQPNSTTVPVIISNSTTARLQIRGAGPSPIVESFAATDKLETVYFYLEGKGFKGGKLSTTYPRKMITKLECGDKTLKELDLVPSAVLNWSL